MPACNWCGGDDEDVTLVAGPHDLFICADCVAVCAAALGRQLLDPDAVTTMPTFRPVVRARQEVWQIPNNDLIPFLAAFFDEHGSISIVKARAKRNRYQINCRVTCTDRCILDSFVERFGGSNIKPVRRQSARMKWTCGESKAIPLIKDFYEHCGWQRPFFDIVLRFYDAKMRGSDLEQFYQEFQAARRSVNSGKRQHIVVMPQRASLTVC